MLCHISRLANSNREHSEKCKCCYIQMNSNVFVVDPQDSVNDWGDTIGHKRSFCERLIGLVGEFIHPSVNEIPVSQFHVGISDSQIPLSHK